MKTAALFTYDRAGKATCLCSPDVPFDAARAVFRKLLVSTKDGNDKIVQAQLWTSSSGMVKRRKWLTSDQIKASAAAAKRESDRVEALKNAALAKAKK